MVPTLREQLHHDVANAVIPGLHDVFLADEVDEGDPMSLKKLLKLKGIWEAIKAILGFEFNGNVGWKDRILEGPKWELLLTILKKWIRSGQDGQSCRTCATPLLCYQQAEGCFLR